MHSDLEILEDLVLNKLTSNSNIDSVNVLEDWIAIAQNYKTKFPVTLLKTIFNHQTDEQTCHYIQSIQSRLIFLSDKLFISIYKDEENEAYHPSKPLNLLKVQESVHLNLEELIEMIEKDFHKYFNYDEKIPEKQRLEAVMYFHKNIGILRKQLKDIDHKLLTLVLNPFQEIIQEQEVQITFRELNYLNKLLDALLDIPISTEGPEKTELLKQELQHFRFNSWKFFEYLAREMTIIVKEQETLNYQLLKYYYFLKCVNQTFFKTDGQLYADKKSLNELLTSWLSEEIYFLEKQLQLNNAASTEESDLDSTGFKIQTNLTVAQLAYFIRLLVDCGIITGKPLKKLLEFLSKHVQTKKSGDSLSSNNLYNLYYTIEDSAKRVVKNFVIKMLNEINKE